MPRRVLAGPDLRSGNVMIESAMHQDLRTVLATVIEAPWGPIHLAASDRGIVAVELMTTEPSFSRGIERRLGRAPSWVDGAGLRDHGAGLGDHGAGLGDHGAGLGDHGASANAHLRLASDRLSRTLGGDHADLAGLALDLADRPDWDRAVLGAVRSIPRGETRSYGDIARAIGRPGAARAVGGAVGRNPIGFIIPCHRVIAGDGTLGGYGGGWWGDRDRMLDLKTDLLRLEGRSVRRRASGDDRAR